MSAELNIPFKVIEGALCEDCGDRTFTPVWVNAGDVPLCKTCHEDLTKDKFIKACEHCGEKWLEEDMLLVPTAAWADEVDGDLVCPDCWGGIMHGLIVITMFLLVVGMIVCALKEEFE